MPDNRYIEREAREPRIFVLASCCKHAATAHRAAGGHGTGRISRNWRHGGNLAEPGQDSVKPMHLKQAGRAVLKTGKPDIAPQVQ
jgi:hypothetical protein